MSNADFFISRGLLSYLAGAFKDDRNIILWAFYMDGVLVIVDEFDNSRKSINKLLINYIGLNFENTTCSKKKESYPNYSRLVKNWEQYKEVNIIDIFNPKYKRIRVAYFCEIDAFDRKTGKPLELKTKFRNPGNSNNLFDYRSATATFFQCMLGNVSEIVVGVKRENHIVDKIFKYQRDKLLNIHGVNNAIKNCCQQLCNNLKKIKRKMENNEYEGCIKIEGKNNCQELIFKYHSKYPNEFKKLFTSKFCKEFSI
uniref:Decapping nuclease n=1 Tax=Strongyloides papillosus TaxID=174720 RepID=A0A0N5BJ34_STREA